MASWTIESITIDPDKTLYASAVFSVPVDGPRRPWTRHLIGFASENGNGQVSSPVLAFDPVTRRARTQSGRVYCLAGDPGGNSDAIYMWCVFKDRHHRTEERNVTEEVYAASCSCVG
jgi:hypothetical protein